VRVEPCAPGPEFVFSLVSRPLPRHRISAPGPLPVCSTRSAFLTVLLSILLAVLLVLPAVATPAQFWPALGLTSLFVLWVSLLSLFGLCWLETLLARRSPVARAWAGFALVQAVVVLLSVLVVVVDLLPLPDLLAHANPGWFIGRNLGISMLVSAVVVRYLILHAQWKAQVQAETQARLESLQARIRPHFLFNTLNTISSLIHDHPDQAEQATMDLSDLLRSGLKDDPVHTLADEVELVRGYLRIEKLRLGERLQVNWSLADDLPLTQPIPALLLQPLVENAIIHGIARMSEGGELSIHGSVTRRKHLRFVIENPLPPAADRSEPGHQIALDNIRQRLELAFEEGARLKTESHDGIFRAEIVIPV
jgi:two-component system, LytTR family, sensor histidine kinase AlgZ